MKISQNSHPGSSWTNDGTVNNFCTSEGYIARLLRVGAHRILIPALLVSLILIIVGTAAADRAAGITIPSSPSVAETSSASVRLPDISGMTEGTVQTHPLMHFTKEQLDEIQRQIGSSPKYNAPRQDLLSSQNLSAGSANLLPYLAYVPSQRDQGSCGDCWVWASTGAVEIDHFLKTGIKNRLSIQYFNSKYNDGAANSGACCGGWLSTYTSWYNTDKTLIPWSNMNATFSDGGSSCAAGATVPVGLISTNPNYPLNSISYSTVSTYGVGQAEAINNIKSALNSNNSVVYSFFYGSAGWTDFDNFWWKNTSSVFDPRPYNGETETGGHSALIVGYDDSTDSSNPYWLVLNSWGAPSNRPDGLFRVTMNLNYDALYNYSGYSYQQHTFQILNSSFREMSGPVANFTGEPVSGAAPLTVTFSDRSTNSPTLWNWTFGDQNTTNATLRNPVHTYTAAGNYSVSLLAGNAVGSNMTTKVGYIDVRDFMTKIGVYHDGAWYLDRGGTGNPADATFNYFGAPGWTPVPGDWNGDNRTEIGISNGAAWYLDRAGTGNPATAAYHNFGGTGWTPVEGMWH